MTHAWLLSDLYPAPNGGRILWPIGTFPTKEDAKGSARPLRGKAHIIPIELAQ